MSCIDRFFTHELALTFSSLQFHLKPVPSLLNDPEHRCDWSDCELSLSLKHLTSAPSTIPVTESIDSSLLSFAGQQMCCLNKSGDYLKLNWYNSPTKLQPWFHFLEMVLETAPKYSSNQNCNGRVGDSYLAYPFWNLYDRDEPERTWALPGRRFWHWQKPVSSGSFRVPVGLFEVMVLEEVVIRSRSWLSLLGIFSLSHHAVSSTEFIFPNEDKFENY